MSGLFRSSDMSYVRLTMAEETAHATLKAVGRFAQAHIVDLSLRHSTTAPSDRQQFYKKRVAQAAYWERKFESFLPLFEQYGLEPPGVDVAAEDLPAGDVLDQVKAYIEPLEASVTKDVLASREQRRALTELEERLAVLQVVSESAGELAVMQNPTSHTYGSFNEANPLLADLDEEHGPADDDDAADDDRKQSGASRLRLVPKRSLFTTSIHGVMAESMLPLFERMVFRVSRGNAIVKSCVLDSLRGEPDATHPQGHRKAVISLMFVGGVMAARLRKVLVYFGGTEYEIAGDEAAIKRLQARLAVAIRDSRLLVSATDREVRASLSAIVWDPQKFESPYVNYLTALRVERAICDAMKCCDTRREGSSLLQCEAWIPSAQYTELQATLSSAVLDTGGQATACQLLSSPALVASGVSAAHLGSPPTYFPTNKFTEAFQNIVDTYGVPRYKEVNPGLFTIISFPFLFGVMYGDIGHGTLLTLAALYFVLRERHYADLVRRKQMDEIVGMIYGGRYMLLLMGMFAVYAGWVYNDCFSIPFDLFGSRFKFEHAPHATPVVGVPVSDRSHYPFGVDPGWYHTTNELAFFNSLKMKLAVTLGVAQMLFGIILSLLNHVHSGDRLGIVFEFVPRMVFMLSTFGYMIFIILYKLCVDWSRSDTPPPNLVQTMISMFLAPGTVDADKQLYHGQAPVQVVLLLLALVSVPIMLLGQPLAARAKHRKLFPDLYGATKKDDGEGSSSSSRSHTRRHSGASYQSVAARDDFDVEEAKSPNGAAANTTKGHTSAESQSDAETSPVPVAAGAGGHGHGADPTSRDFNFSDMCITSGIHAIEFVLGAVSNTASYLRLWALSLAHAELSAVFWDKMIMQYGLNTGSPVMLVIGMAVWAGATFAVLLCMDALECFLHALRLHWVEFQNKFFHADGYAFKPFRLDFVDTSE